MKKLFVTAAVFLTSSAFAAAAPNVAGKWTLHSSIAGNDSDSECTFVQTDAKLTGTCKGPEKDLEVKNGSIDGNKVTWQVDSEYNGTPLTIKYTATVDDAGKMTGTVDVDPFGVSGEFTATSSKADSK
jgi:hypothetical protein